MALNVVDVRQEGHKVIVTLEGSSFTDVSTAEAKQMAIGEGTMRVGLCGISSISGPYPVDENGKELATAEALIALAQQGKQPDKYRNEFTISQSLGL